jgi:hypothetical protein
MIVGRDIHPQKKIYYLGAIVLEILKSSNDKGYDFFSLYQQVIKKEKISINLFTLTLDWLFILGLVGCISNCRSLSYPSCREKTVGLNVINPPMK